MTTNEPIEASDIFLAQSDAVASGPMIWIGPLISLETGWKKGKLPELSSFFFMRFFVRSTNPLLRFFAPVTPGFLLPALVPLYVAWFFYMLRFYLMPWLLGYTVMGMLSFPLESEIAGLIYRIPSPQ